MGFLGGLAIKLQGVCMVWTDFWQEREASVCDVIVRAMASLLCIEGSNEKYELIIS